jgi:fucose 4-O-acetylase-like acetyltransferase
LALLVLYGTGGITSRIPVMLASWLWQVMPLFFFVGGFVHARALRHRPRYAVFVRARLVRLLPPAVVFVAVCAAVAAPIDLSGLGSGEIGRGLRLLPSVLWFLGVYLLVVLLAPAMMRLHRRYRLWIVLAMGVAVAAVDALALDGQRHRIAALNLVFVWLAFHQLGYGYADGSLLRSGRRLAAALAVGGLAATVLLVFGTGAYPVPMVGLPDHPESNMAPPTLPLLTQGMFLIGVALLLRPVGLAWLRRERAWRVVSAGNAMVMTIYCWHPVAVGMVQAVLVVTGVRLPAATAPGWPVVMLGWLAACALCCALPVSIFRRVEHYRAPVHGAAALPVLGGLAAAVGLYLLSQVGLDGLTSLRVQTVYGVPVTAGMALALLAAGTVLALCPVHSHLDRRRR